MDDKKEEKKEIPEMLSLEEAKFLQETGIKVM